MTDKNNYHILFAPKSNHKRIKAVVLENWMKFQTIKYDNYIVINSGSFGLIQSYYYYYHHY